MVSAVDPMEPPVRSLEMGRSRLAVPPWKEISRLPLRRLRWGARRSLLFSLPVSPPRMPYGTGNFVLGQVPDPAQLST